MRILIIDFRAQQMKSKMSHSTLSRYVFPPFFLPSFSLFLPLLPSSSPLSPFSLPLLHPFFLINKRFSGVVRCFSNPKLYKTHQALVCHTNFLYLHSIPSLSPFLFLYFYIFIFFIFLYFYIFIFLYFYIFIFLYFYIYIFLHFYIFIFLYLYIYIFLYFYIFI